jgi:protein TonB
VRRQHFLFVEDTEPAAKAGAHIILPPPKVEPKYDVFAEAMLEDNPAHQLRSGLDWVVSLAVHAAILSVLLILSLYYTTGLDIQKLNLTFLAPPLIPTAAPPPAHLNSSASPRVVHHTTYTPGTLTAPSFIPKAIVTTPGEDTPSVEASMGVPGGIPGGIPGGQVGGVIGGALGDVLKVVPLPLVAEGPKVPVRVGGDVKAPRLLYGPAPEYPILAKQSHLSGVVVIEAVIDEHGNVTGMRVISGHALLIPAALKAVSQRKYEPTILDGAPTPIDLKIEVSFTFS